MRWPAPCHFGFDSPARVCFLSLSGALGFVVPVLAFRQVEGTCVEPKSDTDQSVTGMVDLTFDSVSRRVLQMNVKSKPRQSLDKTRRLASWELGCAD
jgi:hypothetical protein